MKRLRGAGHRAVKTMVEQTLMPDWQLFSKSQCRLLLAQLHQSRFGRGLAVAQR
jgi:hypothetical protein